MKSPFIALSISALLLHTCSAQDSQNESPPVTVKTIKVPESPLNQGVVDALTREIEAVNDAGEKGELFNVRANEHGRAGDWFRTAADFRRAAEADPSTSHHWMRAGVALLLAENPMAYQDLVDSMIKQFAEAESASVYDRERVAKMCTLSKRTVGKQEDVERLIDDAVREIGEGSWSQYFPSTQAIVRYRYGKYKQALESVATSDRINAAQGVSQDVWAINRTVEALCHAKLGDAEEARDSLEQVDKRLREALSDPDIVRDSGYWHDWMIAKLLHDEAREALAAGVVERNSFRSSEKK